MLTTDAIKIDPGLPEQVPADRPRDIQLIDSSLRNNVIWLLMWPFPAFLCFFAFDAPGSENNKIIWAFVLTI